MRLTVCPLSVAVFVGTAVAATLLQKRKKKGEGLLPPSTVVFVVGAPGSGKGTQCSLIQQRLGWAHLGAGDLLRAERQTGSKIGIQINDCIKAGQLVPSEVTCRLLLNGMQAAYNETGKTLFLLDGFPRSKGNADAWRAQAPQHFVKFLLSFECPEEVLMGRLLDRARTSGRNDDNVETIRKRFATYEREEMPIVLKFEDQGMVHRIATDRSVEDIYSSLVKYFDE